MSKIERIKAQTDGLDVLPELLRAARDGWETLDPDHVGLLKWYGLYQHNTQGADRKIADAIETLIVSARSTPGSVRASRAPLRLTSRTRIARQCARGQTCGKARVGRVVPDLGLRGGAGDGIRRTAGAVLLPIPARARQITMKRPRQSCRRPRLLNNLPLMTRAGLEPATYGLKVRCSSIEVDRGGLKIYRPRGT